MEPVRAPAQKGGGVFFASPAWTGRSPDRWRGRRPREASLQEAATHRSAPPGDPRNFPAMSGPSWRRQASPQRSRTLRRTNHPGWRAPAGDARCFFGNPEVSSKGPQGLRHGPEGPAVEPGAPLEPGGPSPWSRRTRWDPEGPRSIRPPRDPRKGLSFDRPAVSAQGGRREPPEGSRAQCPAVAFRTDGPGSARGRPTGPAHVHRNGPAGLAEPQSSLRRSAAPGTVSACPAGAPAGTTPDRSPTRRPPSRAAHALPTSRRFRVPEQGCRAAVFGQHEISPRGNFLVHN
jgi:hypothetical protein